MFYYIISLWDKLKFVTEQLYCDASYMWVTGKLFQNKLKIYWKYVICQELAVLHWTCVIQILPIDEKIFLMYAKKCFFY